MRLNITDSLDRHTRSSAPGTRHSLKGQSRRTPPFVKPICPSRLRRIAPQRTPALHSARLWFVSARAPQLATSSPVLVIGLPRAFRSSGLLYEQNIRTLTS